MNSIKERATKLRLLNGNKITIKNMSNKVNQNYTFGCIIFYLFQGNNKLRDGLFKSAIRQLGYKKLEQLLPDLKNKNKNKKKAITQISNKKKTNISLTTRQYNALIVKLNTSTELAQKVFTLMMEKEVLTSNNIRGGNSYKELIFGLSCVPEYIRIILGNGVVKFFSIDDNLDPNYGQVLLSEILKNIQLSSQTIGKNKTVIVKTMGRTLTKTETNYTFSTIPKNTTQTAVFVKKSKEEIEALLLKHGLNLSVQKQEISNKKSNKLWTAVITLQHTRGNSKEKYIMTVNYLLQKKKIKPMNIKIHGPFGDVVIEGSWVVSGTSFYHKFQTSVKYTESLQHVNALMVSVLLILGLMNISV